ncbi:hypothetical protein AAUPMB_18996 [Pasteurella multocida subsp. multocida str. Anand1_buffalo]|nr:hypothetical protein AAUPMB_18996 [Pasteurella multocida subsp. multocida str. Anand1_buffalo]
MLGGNILACVRRISRLYHDLLSPNGHYQYVVFIIVGQLIAAMVIDHYGLIHMPVREVNLFKFIGIVIVGIGLIIFSLVINSRKLFQ